MTRSRKKWSWLFSDVGRFAHDDGRHLVAGTVERRRDRHWGLGAHLLQEFKRADLRHLVYLIASLPPSRACGRNSLRCRDFGDRAGLRLAGVEEIAGACSFKTLSWQPPSPAVIEYIRLSARVATAARPRAAYSLFSVKGNPRHHCSWKLPGLIPRTTHGDRARPMPGVCRSSVECSVCVRRLDHGDKCGRNLPAAPTAVMPAPTPPTALLGLGDIRART